jgi:hypothetical protein
VRRRVAVCLASCVAGAFLLWPSTAGVAASARAATLSIGPINAVFSEPDRATTYRVPDVTDDPGAKVSYQWSLTLQKVDPAVEVDAACNNRGVLAGTEKTFVWHHGNSGDPVHDDGCDHNLVGRYGHQGLVRVVVTDDRGGRCEATYKGTNSSNATSVQDGTSSTPDCTATPTTPPSQRRCECKSIATRIVPSSVRIERPNGPRLKLRFTLHWLLVCGPGNKKPCVGALQIEPPSGTLGRAKYKTMFSEGHGPGFHLFCDGDCAQATDGGEPVTLTDIKGNELGPIARSLESIPIVIQRTCYRAFEKKAQPPLRLRIAFDDEGGFDVKRSTLR